MHLMYIKQQMHITSIFLSYCRDRVLTHLKTLEKRGIVCLNVKLNNKKNLLNKLFK